MRLSMVTVSYRKQVADGNYGTEAAEVTLAATIDEEGEESDADLTASVLLVDARRIVYQKLNESPNMTVRRALRASGTVEVA